MIISVLERRSEIGLRRALGATKSQIRTQFLAESILLALIGGVVGVLAGTAATAVHASSKSWAIVIPAEAWRHRLGHRDRPIRRPDASRPSVADAAHRGTANGMSGGRSPRSWARRWRNPRETRHCATQGQPRQFRHARSHRHLRRLSGCLGA
jgi:FtsX-like permease family